MTKVFNSPLVDTFSQQQLCLAKGIAIGDIIKEEIQHSNISTLLCTSKWVLKQVENSSLFSDYQIDYLPSPSPLFRKRTQEKAILYRNTFSIYGVTN